MNTEDTQHEPKYASIDCIFWQDREEITNILKSQIKIDIYWNIYWKILDRNKNIFYRCFSRNIIEDLND